MTFDPNIGTERRRTSLHIAEPVATVPDRGGVKAPAVVLYEDGDGLLGF
jgi:hypothetical protein